jgi:hypothetical protein
MKHHIKLVYLDDGVVSPVDREFDMDRIKVGDTCVFTTPDNKEITCIASPDEDAVCADCVFYYSKYSCSGVDDFCCRYIDSQRPGISYVPIDRILEDL